MVNSGFSVLDPCHCRVIGGAGQIVIAALSGFRQDETDEAHGDHTEQQRVDIADIKIALESEIGHSVSDTYVIGMLKKHGWVKCWMPPGTTKS